MRTHSVSTFGHRLKQAALFSVLAGVIQFNALTAIASTCMAVFQRADARSLWASTTFTDPRTYVPGQPFLFMVHAIRKQGAIEKDPREVDPESRPDLMSLIPRFSASLISNDHPATWSNSGFILDVPTENIVNVWPYDSWVSNRMRQFIEEPPQPLNFSPRGLLRKSDPLAYNEVGVNGTSQSGQEVRVTGIFIKVDKNGYPLSSDQWLRKLEALAQRYQLPIIEIQDFNQRPGDDAFARSPRNMAELINAADTAP